MAPLCLACSSSFSDSSSAGWGPPSTRTGLVGVGTGERLPDEVVITIYELT